VEIPEGMQRAMAREAEAIREKRARIIKAEAELEASVKLTQGAEIMARSPMALELRRMQMLSEIGIDNNTTTVIMMPSEFMSMATPTLMAASAILNTGLKNSKDWPPQNGSQSGKRPCQSGK